MRTYPLILAVGLMAITSCYKQYPCAESQTQIDGYCVCNPGLHFVFNYGCSPDVLPDATFTPAGGWLDPGEVIVLKANDEDSIIKYTTDDTIPNESTTAVVAGQTAIIAPIGESTIVTFQVTNSWGARGDVHRLYFAPRAAPVVDAGPIETIPDAGPVETVDAGTDDAGMVVVDAGETPDAGSAVPDSGATEDADAGVDETTDAGDVDAGPI